MDKRKWIFVVQPTTDQYKVDAGSLKLFSKTVLEKWAPALEVDGIEKIKTCFTEECPPSFNLFRFKKEQIAMFHLWGNVEALKKAQLVTEQFNAQCDIFEVNEIAPLDYKMPLNVGFKFPVPVVTTSLVKKVDIDIDTFRDFWHNHYTPLAMSIIPLELYVKSEISSIVKSVNDSNVTGIVEETCATKTELFNPAKFFGGSWLKLIPNLMKINKGVNSFLDLKSIKVYYLHEYFTKV